MAKKVNPIPAGYHSVTPYLICKDAAKAIDFYKEIFGAIEAFRMDQDDGRVGHAELRLGDSRIMVSDEFPEMDICGPKSPGNTGVSLYHYVDDVDAVVDKAVTMGARLKYPVKDQFYGDRSGTVEDPFGHIWHVSTHKEDVPPEELKRRQQATASP